MIQQWGILDNDRKIDLVTYQDDILNIKINNKNKLIKNKIHK